MSAEVGLVAATALHAGFQLVVTLLVYPVLAATPAESWRVGHDAHTRRIAPVVVVVYGSLLVAVVTSLVAGVDVVGGAAVVVSSGAVVLTAVLAGPAHRRLGSGHDVPTLQRLLFVDRARLVCAVAGAALALVAVA